MFCACVLLYIEAYVIVPVLGIDSLCVCVRVDIEVYEILPIGLALIVRELVSVLTLKPMRSCPCLALILD